MKILYGPTSPYSAKVRMAAHHAGVEAESVRVSTEEPTGPLIDNNPLGKIPVLVLDDGQAIFDSRVIMQYLNRIAPGKVFPRSAARRTEAETLEALCDGITDCLLAIVYERRFHPAEKIHEPWIERNWVKVGRGLDYLEAHLPKIGRGLHGGHFALAALIGYLHLRFPGQWEKGHRKLTRWTDKFEVAFPDYQAFKPQG